MKFYKTFVMIILVYFSNNVIIKAAEGTTACGFLKFSESAKEASLAGSYSSYNENADSIFSNPAGLLNSKDGELYFGFSNYIAGSKLAMLSYKTSKKDIALAFGVMNFYIDGIEKRINDVVGIVPSAGNFSSRDTVLIFTIGKNDFLKKVIDGLDFGASFKIYNSKIDDKSGNAFGVDIGFLYKYQSNISFSFVVSNLATKIKYVEDSDYLPFSIKAGSKYKLSNKVSLLSDFEHYIYDEKIYPSLGIECLIKNSFFIRTGYKFGYDTSNLGWLVGLGLGFGINTKDIDINYAYLPFGELGNVNKFDIVFRF
ncbi:MAG: PorV/PorQ family protein [Elusimicrobiales bacterium]|nr:PorV/PorQ family protein [Elusimicrobiales bacterium]